MNREVHVRFWERLEVKALRATRQKRRSDRVVATSGLPRGTDIAGPTRWVRFVPTTDVRYIDLVRISEPRRARLS
jgi:hypothetical protein